MAAILTIMFLAAGVGPPSAPYAAAIQRYASGETDAAVAALGEWPETRVRDEVRALVRLARKCSSPSRPAGPDCDPATVWPGLSISAALMLHTDCAQAAGSLEVHDRSALTIAELMSGFPSLAAFAERWFDMRARLARADNVWDEAASWAERGVTAIPRSASLWLLLGSIEETLGTQEASRRLDAVLFDPDPLRARARLLAAPQKRVSQAASRRADSLGRSSDPLPARARSGPRTEPWEHLARARQALLAALEIDPERVEARLRVARVAWWRGDLAEAQAELQRVLQAKPGEPGAVFLAQLFLGRVQEDAGQLAEAAASYQVAVSLHPQCQSARLARSNALRRLGDPAAARREVEIALRNGGSRARPDSYWLYLAPPAGAAEDALAGLRREVTR